MLEYNIIEVLNELNKNAIFRLSLTSKELFHSNFWAWMIEKYPQKFTAVFYSKYDGRTKPEVFREKYNFDLLLKIGEKFIIIENKFKSLPDKNQLLHYLEKAKDWEDKELVLISYMPPSFSLSNQNEHFVSYDDLYSKLSKINLTDIEIQDKAIIENYIECIGLLTKLQKSDIYNVETLSEFWKKYKSNELEEKLEKINFKLTIQRIFMGNIISKLQSNVKYPDFSCHISTGSNHIVYVDFYGKNSKAFITLCCNGEYRYMFKIPKDDMHNTREELIELCDKKYGEFLSDKDCIVKRKDYNCFMDKDCAWIYKKKDVSSIPFKELAHVISNELIELDKI